MIKKISLIGRKKLSKYYEKYQERLANWLSNFADQYARRNNITEVKTEEPKKASYMENILDVMNKNKKTAIETRIEDLRQRVGLDMLDSIEKSGENDENNKEATKKAAYMPLSIRDKIAQSDPMQDVKQFVNQIIANRNGAMSTPAIFEQLEKFLKLDKEWLRENYDEIKGVIDEAHKSFVPKTYNNIAIDELARTDDPGKDQKEPPPLQYAPNKL
jgi:hypothetical protein